MKKIALLALLPLLMIGCDETRTADRTQTERQEQIQQELAAQIGMPAVKNGREMKLLKMILEMRDQNIATYTYVFSEMTGKFRLLGNTVGFGIPYATQYTSPQKLYRINNNHEYSVVPQADPNGLFSPQSAEGTWILMKDPSSDQISPVYVEPRITVSKFKLPANVVD